MGSGGSSDVEYAKFLSSVEVSTQASRRVRMSRPLELLTFPFNTTFF